MVMKNKKALKQVLLGSAILFVSSSAMAAGGLAAWLTGFSDDITAVVKIALAVFFVIGLFLVGKGFLNINEFRNNPQANPGGAVTGAIQLGIGGALMSLLFVSGVFQQTATDGKTTPNLAIPMLATTP